MSKFLNLEYVGPRRESKISISASAIFFDAREQWVNKPKKRVGLIFLHNVFSGMVKSGDIISMFYVRNNIRLVYFSVRDSSGKFCKSIFRKHGNGWGRYVTVEGII